MDAVSGWRSILRQAPRVLQGPPPGASSGAGLQYKPGVGDGGRGQLVITRGTLETGVLGRGGGTSLVIFDNATLRATPAGPGPLQLIEGFSAGELDIREGGLTIDDAGLSVSVGSPLAGVGALTKTGSGTLVLNATNTYEAGTTIKAGTLQVVVRSREPEGEPGASIVGDVTVEEGASLVLSSGVVFGGLISGGGRVEAVALNNFILRDNTYTGATTVSGGKLQQWRYARDRRKARRRFPSG